MARKLVLFCDGTNNQCGIRNTNVVRLLPSLAPDGPLLHESASRRHRGNRRYKSAPLSPAFRRNVISLQDDQVPPVLAIREGRAAAVHVTP